MNDLPLFDQHFDDEDPRFSLLGRSLGTSLPAAPEPSVSEPSIPSWLENIHKLDPNYELRQPSLPWETPATEEIPTTDIHSADGLGDAGSGGVFSVPYSPLLPSRELSPMEESNILSGAIANRELAFRHSVGQSPGTSSGNGVFAFGSNLYQPSADAYFPMPGGSSVFDKTPSSAPDELFSPKKKPDPVANMADNGKVVPMHRLLLGNELLLLADNYGRSNGGIDRLIAGKSNAAPIDLFKPDEMVVLRAGLNRFHRSPTAQDQSTIFYFENLARLYLAAHPERVGNFDFGSSQSALLALLPTEFTPDERDFLLQAVPAGGVSGLRSFFEPIAHNAIPSLAAGLASGAEGAIGATAGAATAPVTGPAAPAVALGLGAAGAVHGWSEGKKIGTALQNFIEGGAPNARQLARRADVAGEHPILAGTGQALADLPGMVASAAMLNPVGMSPALSVPASVENLARPMTGAAEALNSLSPVTRSAIAGATQFAGMEGGEALYEGQPLPQVLRRSLAGGTKGLALAGFNQVLSEFVSPSIERLMTPAYRAKLARSRFFPTTSDLVNRYLRGIPTAAAKDTIILKVVDGMEKWAVEGDAGHLTDWSDLPASFVQFAMINALLGLRPLANGITSSKQSLDAAYEQYLKEPKPEGVLPLSRQAWEAQARQLTETFLHARYLATAKDQSFVDTLRQAQGRGLGVVGTHGVEQAPQWVRDYIAQRFGTGENVVLRGENTAPTGNPAALWNPRTGEIWVDLDSPVRQIAFSHEISHFVWSWARQNNPALYSHLKALADMAPTAVHGYVRKLYPDLDPSSPEYADEVCAVLFSLSSDVRSSDPDISFWQNFRNYASEAWRSFVRSHTPGNPDSVLTGYHLASLSPADGMSLVARLAAEINYSPEAGAPIMEQRTGRDGEPPRNPLTSSPDSSTLPSVGGTPDANHERTAERLRSVLPGTPRPVQGSGPVYSPGSIPDAGLAAGRPPANLPGGLIRGASPVSDVHPALRRDAGAATAVPGLPSPNGVPVHVPGLSSGSMVSLPDGSRQVVSVRGDGQDAQSSQLPAGAGQDEAQQLRDASSGPLAERNDLQGSGASHDAPLSSGPHVGPVTRDAQGNAVRVSVPVHRASAPLSGTGRLVSEERRPLNVRNGVIDLRNLSEELAIAPDDAVRDAAALLGDEFSGVIIDTSQNYGSDSDPIHTSVEFLNGVSVGDKKLAHVVTAGDGTLDLFLPVDASVFSRIGEPFDIHATLNEELGPLLGELQLDRSLVKSVAEDYVHRLSFSPNPLDEIYQLRRSLETSRILSARTRLSDARAPFVLPLLRNIAFEAQGHTHAAETVADDALRKADTVASMARLQKHAASLKEQIASASSAGSGATRDLPRLRANLSRVNRTIDILRGELLVADRELVEDSQLLARSTRRPVDDRMLGANTLALAVRTYLLRSFTPAQLASLSTERTARWGVLDPESRKFHPAPDGWQPSSKDYFWVPAPVRSRIEAAGLDLGAVRQLSYSPAFQNIVDNLTALVFPSQHLEVPAVLKGYILAHYWQEQIDELAGTAAYQSEKLGGEAQRSLILNALGLPPSAWRLLVFDGNAGRWRINGDELFLYPSRSRRGDPLSVRASDGKDGRPNYLELIRFQYAEFQSSRQARDLGLDKAFPIGFQTEHSELPIEDWGLTVGGESAYPLVRASWDNQIAHRLGAAAANDEGIHALIAAAVRDLSGLSKDSRGGAVSFDVDPDNPNDVALLPSGALVEETSSAATGRKRLKNPADSIRPTEIDTDQTIDDPEDVRPAEVTEGGYSTPPDADELRVADLLVALSSGEELTPEQEQALFEDEQRAEELTRQALAGVDEPDPVDDDLVYQDGSDLYERIPIPSVDRSALSLREKSAIVNRITDRHIRFSFLRHFAKSLLGFNPQNAAAEILQAIGLPDTVGYPGTMDDLGVLYGAFGDIKRFRTVFPGANLTPGPEGLPSSPQARAGWALVRILRLPGIVPTYDPADPATLDVSYATVAESFVLAIMGVHDPRGLAFVFGREGGSRSPNYLARRNLGRDLVFGLWAARNPDDVAELLSYHRAFPQPRDPEPFLAYVSASKAYQDAKYRLAHPERLPAGTRKGRKELRADLSAALRNLQAAKQALGTYEAQFVSSPQPFTSEGSRALVASIYGLVNSIANRTSVREPGNHETDQAGYQHTVSTENNYYQWRQNLLSNPRLNSFISSLDNIRLYSFHALLPDQQVSLRLFAGGKSNFGPIPIEGIEGLPYRNRTIPDHLARLVFANIFERVPFSPSFASRLLDAFAPFIPDSGPLQNFTPDQLAKSLLSLHSALLNESHLAVWELLRNRRASGIKELAKISSDPSPHEIDIARRAQSYEAAARTIQSLYSFVFAYSSAYSDLQNGKRAPLSNVAQVIQALKKFFQLDGDELPSDAFLADPKNQVAAENIQNLLRLRDYKNAPARIRQHIEEGKELPPGLKQFITDFEAIFKPLGVPDGVYSLPDFLKTVPLDKIAIVLAYAEFNSSNKNPLSPRYFEALLFSLRHQLSSDPSLSDPAFPRRADEALDRLPKLNRYVSGVRSYFDKAHDAEVLRLASDSVPSDSQSQQLRLKYDLLTAQTIISAEHWTVEQYLGHFRRWLLDDLLQAAPQNDDAARKRFLDDGTEIITRRCDALRPVLLLHQADAARPVRYLLSAESLPVDPRRPSLNSSRDARANLVLYGSTIAEHAKDVLSGLRLISPDQFPSSEELDAFSHDYLRLCSQITSRFLSSPHSPQDLRRFLSDVNLLSSADPLNPFLDSAVGTLLPSASYNGKAIMLYPDRSWQRYLSRVNALSSSGKPYFVFDIETTGLQNDAEVAQIAVQRHVNGRADGDPVVLWVKTDKPLPQMVGNAPNPLIEPYEQARAANLLLPPADALRQFFALVGSNPLVGHNIYKFDVPFLRRIAEQHGVSFPISNLLVDTLILAKALKPGLESYSLSDLDKEFSSPIGSDDDPFGLNAMLDGASPAAHTANGDVERNVRVLDFVLKSLSSSDISSLAAGLDSSALDASSSSTVRPPLGASGFDIVQHHLAPLLRFAVIAPSLPSHESWRVLNSPKLLSTPLGSQLALAENRAQGSAIPEGKTHTLWDDATDEPTTEFVDSSINPSSALENYENVHGVIRVNAPRRYNDSSAPQAPLPLVVTDGVSVHANFSSAYAKKHPYKSAFALAHDYLHPVVEHVLGVTGISEREVAVNDLMRLVSAELAKTGSTRRDFLAFMDPVLDVALNHAPLPASVPHSPESLDRLASAFKSRLARASGKERARVVAQFVAHLVRNGIYDMSLGGRIYDPSKRLVNGPAPYTLTPNPTPDQRISEQSLPDFASVADIRKNQHSVAKAFATRLLSHGDTARMIQQLGDALRQIPEGSRPPSYYYLNTRGAHNIIDLLSVLAKELSRKNGEFDPNSIYATLEQLRLAGVVAQTEHSGLLQKTQDHLDSLLTQGFSDRRPRIARRRRRDLAREDLSLTLSSGKVRPISRDQLFNILYLVARASGTTQNLIDRDIPAVLSAFSAGAVGDSFARACLDEAGVTPKALNALLPGGVLPDPGNGRNNDTDIDLLSSLVSELEGKTPTPVSSARALLSDPRFTSHGLIGTSSDQFHLLPATPQPPRSGHASYDALVFNGLCNVYASHFARLAKNATLDVYHFNLDRLTKAYSPQQTPSGIADFNFFEPQSPSVPSTSIVPNSAGSIPQAFSTAFGQRGGANVFDAIFGLLNQSTRDPHTSGSRLEHNLAVLTGSAALGIVGKAYQIPLQLSSCFSILGNGSSGLADVFVNLYRTMHLRKAWKWANEARKTVPYFRSRWSGDIDALTQYVLHDDPRTLFFRIRKIGSKSTVFFSLVGDTLSWVGPGYAFYQKFTKQGLSPEEANLLVADVIDRSAQAIMAVNQSHFELSKYGKFLIPFTMNARQLQDNLEISFRRLNQAARTRTWTSAASSALAVIVCTFLTALAAQIARRPELLSPRFYKYMNKRHAANKKGWRHDPWLRYALDVARQFGDDLFGGMPIGWATFHTLDFRFGPEFASEWNAVGQYFKNVTAAFRRVIYAPPDQRGQAALSLARPLGVLASFAFNFAPSYTDRLMQAADDFNDPKVPRVKAWLELFGYSPYRASLVAGAWSEPSEKKSKKDSSKTDDPFALPRLKNDLPRLDKNLPKL